MVWFHIFLKEVGLSFVKLNNQNDKINFLWFKRSQKRVKWSILKVRKVNLKKMEILSLKISIKDNQHQKHLILGQHQKNLSKWGLKKVKNHYKDRQFLP